jgi:hypothetical protein
MDNSQNSNKTFLAVAVLVVIVVVFFGFSKMNSNKQKATSLIGLNGTPSSRLVDSRAREDYELDEDGNPMKPMAVCAITVTSDPSTQSTTALPGVGNQEIARFVAVNPCVDDVMLDKVDYMYIQSGNTWGITQRMIAAVERGATQLQNLQRCDTHRKCLLRTIVESDVHNIPPPRRHNAVAKGRMTHACAFIHVQLADFFIRRRAPWSSLPSAFR